MGLKDLAALKNLQELDLDGCDGLTDVGLKELATLKGLKRLSLHYTKLSDAAVADLKKALPDCEIFRDRTARS